LSRIPPDIIKASIKPGSVYYFREETIRSEEKHYFVVVNRNPSSDEVILLACASSQIEKVMRIRHNCPSDTVVIITPEQYSGFRVTSILDCNYIFKKSLFSLMKKYNDSELLVKPEMDISIVETLRKGVLASNMIARRVKDMLLIHLS